MVSARLPDWETRLVDYLDDARVRVEAGDDEYCALFAAGAVEAVTGDNLADEYRGRYRYVADNLQAVIDEHLPERPRALAQRGDLAWHDGSVGVVTGDEAYFVGERDGVPALVNVPRREWVKVWGVGHG